MDAVDPELLAKAEAAILTTPGVLSIGAVRLRWIGHSLRAECDVVVDADLTLVQAHQIAEDAEHRLLHDVRRLNAATVHTDPYDPDPHAHHPRTSLHREDCDGQQPRPAART